MDLQSTNPSFRILLSLLIVLSLATLVLAKENVSLSVDQTQLSVAAGETFTVTYTVKNPFESALNGKTDSIDQFDLYLLDINDAYLTVESIEPSSWTRESIMAYGDEHLSRLAFNSDRVKVTFKINENAVPGNYLLKGYYSYFGDERTVGLSPNELGETIGPLNDADTKTYARLTITPKKENPLSFLTSSSTNWAGFMVVIGVLILVGVLLLALQHRAKRP